MIKAFMLTCCLILIPQRGLSKDKDVSPSSFVKSSSNEDALSIYPVIESAFTERQKFSYERSEVPIPEELKLSEDGAKKPTFSTEAPKFSDGGSSLSDSDLKGDASKDFQVSNGLLLSVDSSKDPSISNVELIYSTEETALSDSSKTTASDNREYSKSNLNGVEDSIDGLAQSLGQPKRRPQDIDSKPKRSQKPDKAPGNDSDRSRSLDIGQNIGRRVNLNPDDSDASYYDMKKRDHCLTGYMTDLQNWVDENGDLLPHIGRRGDYIDLSRSQEPLPVLHQEIELIRKTNVTNRIRYISLAKCNLKRVPTMFELEDGNGRALHATMEYLTLYGNEFSDTSTAGEQYGEHMNATNAHEIVDIAVMRPVTSPWINGLQHVKFFELKQLDLRNCHIQKLNDYIFRNMPRLEALYLGENNIVFISANAFAGLQNLLHLDLSRNSDKEENVMKLEHDRVFSNLPNLVSLDMSMTLIEQRSIIQFRTIGRNLQRLSLCHTGVSQLLSNVFNNTALRYLDLSGNNGALSAPNALGGLEDKLQVLYAKGVGLKTFDIFYRFSNLELLNIESNEITQVTRTVTKSLKNLQILNLGKNRLTTWFDPIFGEMRKLKFLSVKENNINLISETMLKDVQNISFVGFSGNFMVCNCHTRELYELAYRNQNKTEPSVETFVQEPQRQFSFHNGFKDFNSMISNRQYISKSCQIQKSCPEPEDLESDGNFQFFDYDPNGYKCLVVAEAKSVPISEVDTCLQTRKKADWEQPIEDGWNKLLLLLILPGVALLVLIIFYIYRRNLWYFCITMRNTATLSLINNGTVVDECTIFNYDVFVSYCNEDRNWVLDHLLPHVEKDCNVSVCLHERDFQVGLSILENIVSCMDRSRAIMLVISQRFLLSQWCQFEMHLAQHRLLETRREDLILVLLEEIPRRLRPTTLHYLMLTKTYIVWPKQESEYPVFWRRLMRSLIAQRLKTQDNFSLV